MTTKAPLRMIRIDSARNMRRFYELSVERTIFADWAVVRSWGRIGGSGRLRTDLYADWRDAQAALERLAHKKVRRGYAKV